MADTKRTATSTFGIFTGASSESQYDRVVGRTSHGLRKQWGWESPANRADRTANRYIYLDTPATILEIGSGPGLLAEEILRSCSVRRYVLLDSSTAMHDLAQERLSVSMLRPCMSHVISARKIGRTASGCLTPWSRCNLFMRFVIGHM